MLDKKFKGLKNSTALILLTWLISLGLASAGAFLVSRWIYASVDSPFIGPVGGALLLFIIPPIIFIFAIFKATRLSLKVGYSVSGDRSYTKKQVGTILFAVAGIVLGLGSYIQLGGLPRPPIVLPIICAVILQIVLYLFASALIFTSKDMTRKRMWTLIVFLIMLSLPPIIIYLSHSMLLPVQYFPGD